MRYLISEERKQRLWEHAIEAVEDGMCNANMYADEEEREEARLDEVYTIAYDYISAWCEDDYLCKELARDIMDLFK